MATIRQLVENKTTLDYAALCTALIQQFAVNETVNFNSVLPAAQQKELFGGEERKLIADHPTLSNQKDIRAIALKKGSISQMLFFFVTLTDPALHKKQIEQITKRFIRGSDANRYIIWFFGNTEHSALKVVLSAKEGKKIVLKTLPFGKNQPYYKTYDFILKEVNEKVHQLFVEPTDLWKALWNAFDISIINRNFYNEIKSAFEKLISLLNSKNNPFSTDEDRVQFAIRLIGRIIFCWFLKRKEVLKEEAVSSSAVKAHENKNYYHELLEILFFDVLNTPVKERRGGIPKIISQYPFLNGGLFEAQETDYKDNLLLNINNDWFETFFGNTLEKYNFTVDENSSSNAEIAIDPEMLGRIFENLLAEQNPETGESARKATGSYYTPREIVDYMVEQSIAEYLKTNLGSISNESVIKKDLFGKIINPQLEIVADKNPSIAGELEEAIDDFVHTQHLPERLEKHERQISEALNKIKVLDPACGSGAFPIGSLQKIVALKQQLHPKTKNYKLKLDTIQNSIYGVDVQPMAVELSRLRCWLSLVVDEEPNDIKSLPNLDFKFVCADSLVDVPENEYVKNQSQKCLVEFTNATEQYFNPDYKQKTSLKVTIKRCLNEITNVHDVAINSIITQLRKERNSATAGRLKQLEKSLQDYTKQQSIWHSYRNIFENKKVDFFNIQYFFPLVKNGFDIIIANPPYINVENLNEDTKTYLFENYKTCKGRTDIYIAFIEASLKIVKPNGTLTYIIPYPYTNQNYGSASRKMLIDEYFIKEIVDTSEYFVFESATVKNIILRVIKSEPSSLTMIKTAKSEKDFLENTFKLYQINQQLFLDLKDYRFETKNISEALKLKSELWKNSIRLDEICLIAYGARLNHKTEKISKDVYINKNFEKGDKPFTEGKYIERYSFKQFRWLEYRPDEHYNPMFPELFENDKIIFINVVKDRLRFAFDNQKYYNSHTVINCVKWNLLQNATHITVRRNISNKKINTATKFNYFFLLGILNSNLINWYFLNFLSESLHFYPDDAKELPIPNMPLEVQKSISLLVEYLLFINQVDATLNDYVPNEHVFKQFDELIDTCVYELYFPDEVKEKEANVLNLVAEQFKPIEGLEEPEQIKIIQDGYQLLRDSNNEIRSRMTRQKLVDEIQIINGSFQ